MGNQKFMKWRKGLPLAMTCSYLFVILSIALIVRHLNCFKIVFTL